MEPDDGGREKPGDDVPKEKRWQYHRFVQNYEKKKEKRKKHKRNTKRRRKKGEQKKQGETGKIGKRMEKKITLDK